MKVVKTVCRVSVQPDVLPEGRSDDDERSSSASSSERLEGDCREKYDPERFSQNVSNCAPSQVLFHFVGRPTPVTCRTWSK